MRRVILTSLLSISSFSFVAQAQDATTPAAPANPSNPSELPPSELPPGEVPQTTRALPPDYSTVPAGVAPTPGPVGAEMPAEPTPAPGPLAAWDLSWSGYFRAPVMVGLSHRPDPTDTAAGADQHTQIVYGPNRLLDANYSSFAFTRLEEGDWGEVYLTAKRPHVAATIAFMGYWYTWAGYENPNAAWVPAQAWITLDSDVDLGGIKPHVTFKGGVFWQRWGMFGVYDTYLFGRFHQAGEAVELDFPLPNDLKLNFVHGLGTNRNGSPAAGTGLTLLHYEHLGLSYKDIFDAGLYYNDSWTEDPTLFAAAAGTTPAGGGNYGDARDADMTVAGADVNIHLPALGKLWLASSYIKVKQGWAISPAVEIMHSNGGAGIANNYLAFGQPGSTGSGSLVNFAWLYENSLSNIQGHAKEHPLPDLSLEFFGMMANAKRDLLPGATISDSLGQFKFGADLTLTTTPWLAFMLRFDSVNLDTDNDGYNITAITPRVIFFSNFLSSESIWLQYTHYSYGDNMALATSPTQPYGNPDANVIKLQANIGF